ncbi:MAG: IS110 family transposase [Fusobacteriaceae bacterium]
MIYVGIDIAKKKHFASVMNSDGEVLVEAFSFNNDQVGFSSLLSKISSFEKKDIVIGLESTAHYGENLIFFLFSLGYKVGIINPLQTSNLRKTNIRKTKTDKVDTYLIIKTLMIGEHNYLTSRDITNLELKSYCRFRQNLVKSRTKAKIQLVAYLDQLFPELQYFFKSGIHIKACYTLLKEFTTPKAISEAHLTRLTSLLSKASKGHFGKDRAKELKELAKLSVGIENKALSVQVIHAIEQIELFNKQIAEVEENIEKSMETINSVVKSIPGVGTLNGAMIISEIGDIKRFSHPSKLLAYAGLDPSVNQSGNFIAKKTRMSKRGSKTLRYALINAAFNVSLNDKTFKDYYDLKVSQGRTHYCALGHVAHKLVRVIFKLLNTNTKFKTA